MTFADSGWRATVRYPADPLMVGSIVEMVVARIGFDRKDVLCTDGTIRRFGDGELLPDNVGFRFPSESVDAIRDAFARFAGEHPSTAMENELRARAERAEAIVLQLTTAAISRIQP